VGAPAGVRGSSRLPAAALAALLLVPALRAQEPPRPRPRPDTVRVVADTAHPGVRDTARVRAAADTARPRPDSLNPDSLRHLLPVAGPPPGPLPRHQRIVFTRDDLDWRGARSLGELLAFVPGTFLVRPGWFGTPEFIGYAGQGAAAVELFLDGYFLAPLGGEGNALDLNRFDIGLMRRIEVEVLPTVMRVHMVSESGTTRRPRTEASFATGDAETNTYRGRYLNRWRDGSGIGIAASYFGTNGPGSSPADITVFTAWARATWMPTSLSGVEYTLHTGSLKREAAFGSGSAAPIAALDSRRSDAFLRAFAATRSDGYGLRFDALLGTSSYTDTTGTADADESQASLAIGWRSARWSLEGTSRVRTGRAPLFLQARGSWAPLRSTILAAHAQTTRYLGGTREAEVGVSGEFFITPWLGVYGSVRSRELEYDTTQSVADWAGGLTIRTRPLTLDVSVQRHGAFDAPGYSVFQSQLPRWTSIDVVTLTTSYQVRPWEWLALHGWYRHPLDPIHAAFEPPHHSRTAVTFRSRFMPQFRRGIFDALVQAEVEGWGRGVIGRDAGGTPLGLEGATVMNFMVEFRLVGAILFWTLRNSQFERYALIPGFEMPRGLQRFGVRWEFTN
jgi:hypothetical protein